MVPLEPAITGELLDFVPVFHPPENLKLLGPYVSVLVRLENGCRTFGIFLGSPAALRIGDALVASSQQDDTPRPFFQAVRDH